ncbi:MAG: hypothetical protein ACOC2F_03740 [Bacteroidota bacterium]
MNIKYSILSAMLMLFFFLNTKAQDSTINHEEDMLNCRIIKADDDHTDFAISQVRSQKDTFVKKSEVTRFNYNYQADSMESTHGTNIDDRDYPLFRIALNGGYSHVTQKVLSDVPDLLSDYMEELKSGYHLGGKGTIFIHENIGLGLDFNLFKTSNTLENVSISDNAGNVAFGVIRDDITILFLGPSLSTRVFNSNKMNAFFTHLGAGYLGYWNEGIFMQNLIDLTGNTFGVSAGLGFDIRIVDNILLGLNVSYVIGTITELSANNSTNSESVEMNDNVSHVNVSVGLRFW